MQRNDRLEAAQEKLQQMLQQMHDDIAPRQCAHGDWVGNVSGGDCGCDYEETAPVDNAVLTEFVLVMSWTKMDDGEPFVGMRTAPKQMMTHTNGLLHTALYEM